MGNLVTNMIEECPLLILEEEKEFIIRAQDGDKKAFDYLVLSNSRLVCTLAIKFSGKGLDTDELFQIGIMGLMKAIQNFNLSKGVRLSTYAHMWIQQYMIRNIQNLSRAIRVPAGIFQNNFRLVVATKQLEQELGRNVTPEELGDYTGKTPKEIEFFIKTMVDVCSADKFVGDEKDVKILDIMVDPNSIDTDVVTKATGDEMIKIIKTILNKKEFDIFEKKVGLKDEVKTCKEIATIYNITWQNVHAIYRAGIRKVSKNVKIKEYKCS